MFRYAHTNIIAKDFQKLVDFYKDVFHCKSIGETRDLHGKWLDKLTGISNAHIMGEHLCLPRYMEETPFLYMRQIVKATLSSYRAGFRLF